MKTDNEFFEIMAEIDNRRELGELHTEEGGDLVDKAWSLAPDSILRTWMDMAAEWGMIQTPLSHPARSAEELK